MKQAFTLIVCFFAGISILHAQVTIKPAAGVNFTDFSADPSTGEYKSKTGYQVGGSVILGKRIHFEPGIFWVKKSTEFQDNSTNPSDATYDVSGIRIPVTIGLNLLGKERKTFNFRTLVGFSAFILTDVKGYELDEFNKTQWGLYAGAGIDFSLLFLEFQYEWSLTEVRETVDVGKSRSVFINAGVRLTLGGKEPPPPTTTPTQ